MSLIDDLSVGVYDSTAAVWRDDIKGAHTSLTIGRRPMERGSVGASLASDHLPAGRDELLKTGAAYRLRIGSEYLVSSEIVDRRPEEGSRRAQPLTVLEAADNGRVLQGALNTSVAETLASASHYFANAGFSWLINGSASAGPALTTEAVGNTNMTALDQVVLVRDWFVPSYAWFNRAGVGVINDLANMPATPTVVLNESTYSQLATGFNMDACFNSVTAQRITGDVVDVYDDATSIAQWGLRPTTVKVRHDALLSFPGVLDINEVAQAFLDLNKDPAFQVLSVQVPLHRVDRADLALLDLYDLVTVKNTKQGIDADYYITSIQHEITPKTWVMTLGFTVPGIAAIPQVLPDPPS